MAERNPPPEAAHKSYPEIAWLVADPASSPQRVEEARLALSEVDRLRETCAVLNQVIDALTRAR